MNARFFNVREKRIPIITSWKIQRVQLKNQTIHNRSRIGTVYDAMFSTEKDALVGNVYLNVKRVREIIPKIEKPILAGEAIELSTGVRVTGSYDETKNYINAEHIIFDHLALLPDSKGSCSLADGCGLGVNNNKQEIENLEIQKLYNN